LVGEGGGRGREGKGSEVVRKKSEGGGEVKGEC
jgi:hypothetical protein